MSWPCPRCTTESTVTDTRLAGSLEHPHVRRRRSCPSCAHRWSTREVEVLPYRKQFTAQDRIELETELREEIKKELKKVLKRFTER